MRSFFKTFFATLLALVIFTVIGIFILAAFIGSAASPDLPVVGSRAVLVINLDHAFPEQSKDNPLNAYLNGTENTPPSLRAAIEHIYAARADSAIKGIYLQCSTNANGFAASEELHQALLDFKRSGKFLLAYGETMTQKGYYLGSCADKVFCHPLGGVEWSGFSSGLLFLKGMLDKLEIQPQIFYAGKFKSATEPLRAAEMTDANRLQTSVWLGDLYTHFLEAVGAARKIDTAQLRELAVQGKIQTAHDALNSGLVDGLMYDDEIKSELRTRLHISERESINFVTLSDYVKARPGDENNAQKRIAVLYADGDIVSGYGDDSQVGSDNFKNLIRKLRMDNDVEAIVFRVNSPGGSSLASDVIWRELALARKDKPVVVSMGDVAASGGYYISCMADSVFADAGTITGSIGVFSIVPNLQSFFKNKLGITFDRVKTAPYADMGGADRPLTEPEKRFFQAGIDSVYLTFKTRVADGRRRDITYIDSIAQGRVWTGYRAIQVGLVDRIGTLRDAILCAARMAKLDAYRIKEYPEKKSFIEQLLNNYQHSIREKLLAGELTPEQLSVAAEIRRVKQMVGQPQARMPFSFAVQ
ncbi:MAG TPA: signal peptide peptidase SppA [Sediminibacterium sp.]|nr:signal peptide peptidase SppA [Sediminibacterium sp.]